MTNPGKTALAGVLIVAVVLASCGPKPGPKGPLSLLYEGREETLKELDLSGLEGRKIVIDPGHGGVFRGARGVGGLDEADVNLGVALYLWGLLEEAGAEVVLTRKTDRDFVDYDSLQLRTDLQARVDIVEEARPDVFISLHHNAGVSLDTTFNEIQIYYKIGDEGPSLDIARIFRRHLLINIGEPKTRVIPGNYYVLRNTTVPSVLCEPSYITNTRIESKLKLAEKQRLEAEVYFLALVDYFSRGIPSVTGFAPVGPVATGTPVIRVDFEQSALIDAPTVDIELDGLRLTAFKAGPSAFAAFPASPLRSGKHSVVASARSITGNSSPVSRWDFTVDLKPEILRLKAYPLYAQPPYPQKIVASVLDINGNPVRDSTSVVFSTEGKTLQRPTIDGRASLHVGSDVPFARDAITATCGNLSDRFSPDAQVVQPSGEPETLWVSGFVLDSEGRPIESATVATGQSDGPAFSDRDGYFMIESSGRPGELHISKDGFRDVILRPDGKAYPVAHLERFYRSIDPSAVVTIDAAGGGEDTGWVGPTGTTASGLNLTLAKRIVGFLSSAGIDARLTRRTDTRTSDVERVERCESWNSTLVLSVSQSGGAGTYASIEHYPGSAGGTRLSGLLKDEIAMLTEYSPSVGETAEYLIRQTSCPAVNVTFVVPGTLDGEASLREPIDLWARAYGVFCAVARYLGVEERDTFGVSGSLTENGEASTEGLILVDGCFETIVDTTGTFDLKLLEPGLHSAVAFSGRRESDRLMFDENTDVLEITLKPDDSQTPASDSPGLK
jgi:N-acetylmuramoyl-L-alanine amidase